MTTAQRPTEPQSARLRVEGMHCAACVGRVEQALRGAEGVRSAEVSLAGGVALIRGEGLDPEALARAVRATGFAAAPVTHRESLTERREAMERRLLEAARRWRWRVIVGAAIWAPLETLHWLGPSVGIDTHAGAWLWVGVVASTVALVYVGSAFFASAARAAASRSTNMDTLVSIGAAAAFALSVANLIRMETGGPHLPLYFTEAAGLLTLISLGHWLEASMTARAGAALRELLRLQPEEVTRLADPTDQTGEVIRSETVAPGDLVLVRPGERVAVDGEIIEGQSSLDESIVTGESIPVDRGPGAPVIAGSMNLSGRLIVRTTADGSSTTLARIAEIVLNAQAGKTHIQRLADRVASVFVPAVLCIAAVTFLAWGLLGGEWVTGIVSATTVLVISCPCALGLAAPTAIMVASGAASRRGILVRSASGLERLAGVRAIAFDKTGTLTRGEPRVVRAEDTALTLAASIAGASSHPLSRAIVEAARQRGLAPRSAGMISESPGVGLSGMVEGVQIEVISASKAAERQLAVPPIPSDASVSVVLRAGAVIGGIAFRDEAREEARGVLDSLRAQGLATYLLSGDRPEVVRAFAERLAIPAEHAQGGLTPEGKVERVRELSAKAGPLAMVGDGINDAGALAETEAAGGVGIAMGTGANVAIESAGIVIPGDRLHSLEELLHIAHLTMRTIRQNLTLSFGYNSLAIPAAALGLLGEHGPIIAALAMGFSDFSVLGNSLRLAARLRREAGAGAHQARAADPVLTP